MKTYFETIARFFQPLPVPGYIAKVIADALNDPRNDPEQLITGAGKVRFDLHQDGSYRSSTKKLVVQDRNGYFYEITIKEMTR